MQYSEQDIQNWDNAHNIHPFKEADTNCYVIAEGKGAYVRDINGKKILDGIAGLWCVNIGHGRKELADAMAEQATKLAYYSSFVAFTNVPSTLLAKKVCSLAPDNLNHLYFSLGGSEANDVATRIVHHYNLLRGRPEKKHIIARKNAYHGMTYLTASISGIADNNKNYHTVSDIIHHVSAPSCYRKPEVGMTDDQYVDYLAMEFESKIMEIGENKVAMFFAEPIMGAGGLHVAPIGYHKKMWEICQKYEVMYISDEVVSGFCRLGEFFASEPVFNIKPDIITSAKGITSGYFPLAATIISDEIYNIISQGDFTSGYTYSGHPIGAAVGLKNIEIMEKEDVGGNVKSVSIYMYQKLEELKKYPILGDVRGRNFMIGLEFVKNQESKEAFPESVKVAGKIVEECFANGLIVRPLGGGIIVVSPPLIWKRSHVDEFIFILEEAIKNTIDQLTCDGHL